MQLLVPIGFAHGFCVVSDSAEVLYKVSSVFDPATECSLRWDDPGLNIAWPLAGRQPLVSAKDAQGMSFDQF